MNAFEISTLAKTDPDRAAEALLAFVRTKFPQIGVERLQITPSKLSLNSVSGFLLGGAGAKFFFKFHAEENEREEAVEYYNAKLLFARGLPVIMPLFSATEAGGQFVIYDFLSHPTAFEEYEKEERAIMAGEAPDDAHLEALLRAETALIDRIRGSYLASLKLSRSADIADAPVHQLFYRRLVSAPGTEPRVRLFYEGKTVHLPGGSMPFDELASLRWVVNGVRYDETLAEIIARSKIMLDPLRADTVPTVIGHGDDHNGNKFFTGEEFIFFDPAFAGVQPALLSFVKATVHNVFVHPFWLYDPARLMGNLRISLRREQGTIIVEHDWEVAERAPFRWSILRRYEDGYWRPLIGALRERGWLPRDWQEYLRRAMFCCPFLVTNLIDPAKYSSEQSLLALAKCVELGSLGDRETPIQAFLGRIDT